jgi:hypothetical protein
MHSIRGGRDEEHDLFYPELLDLGEGGMLQELAETWAENEGSGLNSGYTVYWGEEEPTIAFVKIKSSQCGCFH